MPGDNERMSRVEASLAKQLEIALAKCFRYEAALKKIACFDDLLANDNLEVNNSFGCFDEPGSVEIAREALRE